MRQAAYASYLDRFHAAHPNLINPVIAEFSEAKELNEIRGKSNPLTGSPKWFIWNHDTETHQLPDGRVVELAVSREASFYWPKAAIWPSLEAWQNFDMPMSPRAYREEW